MGMKSKINSRVLFRNYGRIENHYLLNVEETKLHSKVKLTIVPSNRSLQINFKIENEMQTFGTKIENYAFMKLPVIVK